MVVAHILEGSLGWLACCGARYRLQTDGVLLLCLCVVVLGSWICTSFCFERYRLAVVSAPCRPMARADWFPRVWYVGVMCVICCSCIVSVLTIPPGSTCRAVRVRASILAHVRHILACLPGGRIVENGVPVLFHPFCELAHEICAAKEWVVL